MSIRLRLALWYGALFAGILFVVALLSYAFHVRAHYDDIDRALITSAGHAGAMISAGDTLSVGVDPGMGNMLRLYNAQRQLIRSSGYAGLPAIDPQAMLAAPSGPAYGTVPALVPALMPGPPAPLHGALGLLEAEGQRWRVYVLPLAHTGPTTGYVVALMSLGHLDASITRYRLLLLGLGLAGVTLSLGGSWLLARRALRPVADLTATAEAIAHAQRVHDRVPVPPQHDELGRLATTFNEMLDSLDEVQRAQERFVSDASHELRAPLTAIQGNVELLLRQQAMPEAERVEALQEVEREAHRLSRLVADLLALARADAGVSLRRQVVDLDVVVLKAFGAARKLARGQTLRLEDFDAVQVWGDADRLHQLILILLDNALKYTPAGGAVTLSLGACDDQALVTIHDTGVGIASDALPHVFERFFRADPARGRDPGGTGLGLPIAQWIVEQHSGAIDLQSAPGHGTTAVVRLPLLDATSVPTETQSTIAASSMTR